MFPFDSVFYHLVLFAFNCLIFKELCRWFSHRLCLATAFIYYHVLNFLSTLFSNYFQFCFSVVTVLLTTLLSYHLLTLFVNIFFPLLSTFFSTLNLINLILLLLYNKNILKKWWNQQIIVLLISSFYVSNFLWYDRIINVTERWQHNKNYGMLEKQLNSPALFL